MLLVRHCLIVAANPLEVITQMKFRLQGMGKCSIGMCSGIFRLLEIECWVYLTIAEQEIG